MIRSALGVLAAIIAAALVVGDAAGKRWPSLEFRPAIAAPGDSVAVRVSLTPRHYVAPPQPGGPRIEIVLVPARLAQIVNSVEDDGVVRVATIRSDINWRGSTTFRLPDLEPGRYVGAYLIAGTFYAPYAGAPLDNRGFRLVVRDSENRQTLASIGFAAVLVLCATWLVVRRRQSPVHKPVRS